MHQDDVLQDDAANVAQLLPRLMRQLNAGLHDPVVQLPLAQLRVLRVLRGGAMPMSAVGRELHASLSAMTQLADRLELARLVTRVPRGDDRRVRCLQLTERGERMMALHDEARVKIIAKVLGSLTPTERRQVTSALETFVEAAAASNDLSNAVRRRAASNIFA